MHCGDVGGGDGNRGGREASAEINAAMAAVLTADAAAAASKYINDVCS